MQVRATTRRISVVGPSGSGKSHLSETLSRLLGLPLYQLDQIGLDPSGRELSPAEFFAAVSEIAARDAWIIDGHYRDVRDMIWGRSEAVIWLSFSPLIVGGRLVRRNFRKKLALLRNRKSGPYKSGDNPAAPQSTRARWLKRLLRVKKMVREQREYGALLQQSHYPQAQIVEISSLQQMREWEAGLAAHTARARPPHSSPLDSAPASARPVLSFIELFGLPGAGKTTLIDAIGEDPGLKTRLAIAEEWRRKSVLRKLGYFIRTLFDPPLIAAAIQLVFTARLTRGESLWRLLRLITMKHWWLSHSGVLLFDQGALQSIWSVLFASKRTSPDPEAITRLIRALFTGMQAQIIVIEVDKSLAASRIVARTDGTSRFDGLALEVVEKNVERSISLVHAIVAAARAAGIDVQTLDGAEPVLALAGQLEQLLNRSEHDRSGPVGGMGGVPETGTPSSNSIIRD